MSRRVKWIGIGVAAVVLILCIAILTVYLKPNSVAGTPQNVVFTVDKDQTGAEIGDMLYEKGIISSPTTFRMALRLTGLMDKLQQGYYQIPQNASLRQVISLLQKGKVQSIKVTIPEGYTIQQIAAELEKDGLGPKEAFLEVAKTYVPYQYMYGPAQVDYRVEGFLFPSTYEIPVGSTPQEILKRMAGEMNKQLTPAIREQIAAKHMTIFEFITTIDKSELTICAGGRYDSLVEYFGGPETAGFGFGLGLERLLLVLDKQGIELPVEENLDVYIAVLGSGANGKALELVQAIRYQGFKAERDYLGRKIKAQFKSADTFKAKTVITLGESEVESGQVNVKNNATREEVTVSFEELTKNFAAVLEQLEK